MYHSSLTPLLIQTRSEHVYKDRTIKRDSHLSKELRKSILVSRHGIPVDCVCMLSHVQLCHPMDCSLPASFAYGITQARILEWVAISSFRGSSWPRARTRVSHIAGRFFIFWATREAPADLPQSHSVVQTCSINLEQSSDRWLSWTRT